MLKILFFSLALTGFNVVAEDHGHEENHKEEHGEEHGDEHGDEHGSEGFKLSETATKNFELTYAEFKTPSVTISTKAIFRGLSEVNIYRFRNGLYKRVDFKTLEKTKDTIKVSSSDLQSGDKIVINGIGFLRIAEIAASGGISDSHSH